MSNNKGIKQVLNSVLKKKLEWQSFLLVMEGYSFENFKNLSSQVKYTKVFVDKDLFLHNRILSSFKGHKKLSLILIVSPSKDFLCYPQLFDKKNKDYIVACGINNHSFSSSQIERLNTNVIIPQLINSLTPVHQLIRILELGKKTAN
jgi:hypothetical protein